MHKMKHLKTIFITVISALLVWSVNAQEVSLSLADCRRLAI